MENWKWLSDRSCSFLLARACSDLMLSRKQNSWQNFISAAERASTPSPPLSSLLEEREHLDYWLFLLRACALWTLLLHQLIIRGSSWKAICVFTDAGAGWCPGCCVVRWSNMGQLSSRTWPIIARERRTGALGPTHLITGWRLTTTITNKPDRNLLSHQHQHRQPVTARRLFYFYYQLSSRNNLAG